MPLIAGTGAKAHAGNVGDMIRSFKKTGRIGNSRPGAMRKALAQANAAAYRKQRDSRRTIAHG